MPPECVKKRKLYGIARGALRPLGQLRVEALSSLKSDDCTATQCTIEVQGMFTAREPARPEVSEVGKKDEPGPEEVAYYFKLIQTKMKDRFAQVEDGAPSWSSALGWE